MNKAEIIVVSILILMFDILIIWANNLDFSSAGAIIVTNMLSLKLGIDIMAYFKKR